MEDSIEVGGRQMPKKERAAFLEPLLSDSVSAAEAAGKSLALIRPRNTRFHFKSKEPDKIEEERRAYEKAASQGSFFDQELAALDPSPYEFRFEFEDGEGAHNYANNDWEAHAMFWKERQRKDSDQAALDWMSKTFNDKYPEKGMLFCVGNMARRPQTWLLLGVLRVDKIEQRSLF